MFLTLRVSVWHYAGTSDSALETRMSLARLRRVLTTPLHVTVESSNQMVALTTAAIRHELNPKTAAVYAPLANPQSIQFRPIDFLRKIGELTTPKGVNLARLSASWATRRYFWALHDYSGKPGTQPKFKLSQDARQIDRHQKTLLSDEFGMGFAGIVAERLLQAPEFVEVDFAVSNPQQFFGAKALERRRPDFLMWGAGTPLFIVECKGSQKSRAGVVKQLRRGLEQLPSIDVGNLSKVALVIATHLRNRETVVHVIDPDDEPRQTSGKRRAVDETIDQIGSKEFSVSNPERFAQKLRVGVDLMRLRWTGQHATADAVERKITGRTEPRDVANAPLERLQTDLGPFLGTSSALAPELGRGGPRLFRGVQEEFLSQSEPLTPSDLKEDRTQKDVRFSAGANGTCLSVLGLDM